MYSFEREVIGGFDHKGGWVFGELEESARRTE